MAEEIEYVTTEEIPMNNMAIFQQEKAIIERMMEWAERHPRNKVKIINELVSLVSDDKELASSCTYSVPKSGNPTGPSVVLAKMIVREYGNMRTESRIVGFDATHVTSEATVFDLQKNYGVRCQVRRSIMTSKGARYDETTATTTGMAGCAIALRNAIFQLVDPYVVKRVHDAAKKKVLGDVSTKDKLIATRTKFVNGLKDLYQSEKLTDAEIAGACGKKLIEHIDQDGLLTLAAIESGLRSGEMDFDKVFRSKVEQEPIVMPDKSIERIKALIKSSETKLDLEKLKDKISTNDLRMLYDKKFAELK